MNKKRAIAFLLPYIDRIVECIRKSMKNYVQSYKADERIYTTTTIANIIQNHVVHHIEVAFADEEGITPIRTENQFLLNINGEVNLRFKKLKKNLTSSNYPTKRSKKFGTCPVGHNQMKFVFDEKYEEIQRQEREKQRQINHLLETTKIGWTVGWLLNETVTEARPYITWPDENRKKNHWSIDVENEMGKVIQLPEKSAKEEKKPKKRRVRVKGKEQQEGEKKKDGTSI